MNKKRPPKKYRQRKEERRYSEKWTKIYTQATKKKTTHHITILIHTLCTREIGWLDKLRRNYTNRMIWSVHVCQWLRNWMTFHWKCVEFRDAYKCEWWLIGWMISSKFWKTIEILKNVRNFRKWSKFLFFHLLWIFYKNWIPIKIQLFFLKKKYSIFYLR